MQCPFCQLVLQKKHRKHYVERFGFYIRQCPQCRVQIKEVQAQHLHDTYSYYDKKYYQAKQPTRSSLSQRCTQNKQADASYHYYDERRHDLANRIVWQSRLQTIAKYIPRPAKLLDVGCGFGGFVATAQDFGYQASGLDVSEYATRVAQHGALPVYCGRIEQLAKNVTLPLSELVDQAPFDIITLIEVIEHIANPTQAFVALAKLLRPAGILVIQTANLDGIQAQLAGSSYHYYLPGHFYYYSYNNLQTALKPFGFSPLRCYRPVDFSLITKLKKMMNIPKTTLSHFIRASGYHLLSYVALRSFAVTSSMVYYFKRDGD